MDQVIDTIKLFIGVTYFCIVNSFKSFLPNGVLPRKSVQGKRVLITGAGNGIGRLMALEFSKLGAELVLWDINEAGNNETKNLIVENGGKAHTYTIDLSKYQEIHRVSKITKEEVGDIDILINNAGIVTGKKIFDCPDELMEKTMAVNTNAIFYTAKDFLPSMLQRDSGHIVTIASMAGKAGTAGLVDYCASKFGAVGCHESLGMEIVAQGKYGVKTTLVCPFFINTGMFDGAVTASPLLFPILEPDYAVDCIMEAVLTDRPMLCMPKATYTVLAIIGILPVEAQVLIAHYFGTNHSMDDFTGRTLKKND